jgi:small subunit ribosomal protein S10
MSVILLIDCVNTGAESITVTAGKQPRASFLNTSLRLAIFAQTQYHEFPVGFPMEERKNVWPSMPKRIRKADSTHASGKRTRATRTLPKAVQWECRILLHLEGEDPKLLDKETQKVYRRIDGTGAKILGPVPLPAQRLPEGQTTLDADRIHRRLFRILFPTERTVSLLEKLDLSGAVRTSISVEEIPPQENP